MVKKVEKVTNTKKFKIKKVKTNPKTSKKSGGWNISDLTGASYNPRFITNRRLDNLGKSYKNFGDLSGIVFNRRSGTLVSGHQRLSFIRKNGFKTKLTTEIVDETNTGTVERGFMLVRGEDGSKYSIPFRVVDWEDKKVEYAANIAANAHGGEFDNAKLAFMVEELEILDGGFDIDSIGLDLVTLKSLPDLPAMGDPSDPSDSPKSFDSYDEDSFDEELDQTCPKCHYKFAKK
jgi:hypothetical protein